MRLTSDKPNTKWPSNKWWIYKITVMNLTNDNKVRMNSTSDETNETVITLIKDETNKII